MPELVKKRKQYKTLYNFYLNNQLQFGCNKNHNKQQKSLIMNLNKNLF